MSLSTNKAINLNIQKLCALPHPALSLPSFWHCCKKKTLATLYERIQTHNHSFALERWEKCIIKYLKISFKLPPLLFLSLSCCSSTMWRNNLWQRLFAHRKKCSFEQFHECMICESNATISHWFKRIHKLSEKMPSRHDGLSSFCLYDSLEYFYMKIQWRDAKIHIF